MRNGDPYRDSLDDLHRKLRWDMAIGSPFAQVKIVNHEVRTAEEIMADLKAADPDGHALLSEHIIIESEER